MVSLPVDSINFLLQFLKRCQNFRGKIDLYITRAPCMASRVSFRQIKQWGDSMFVNILTIHSLSLLSRFYPVERPLIYLLQLMKP